VIVSASAFPRVACGCTKDEYGPVYCDAHQPAPPPNPPGACVLCHMVDPANEPMVTGKDGVRWHPACAA
jgi:hypothetical protein